MVATPPWAIEHVRLVDHDPAWAEQAVGFAHEVRTLFADWLIGDVEHVGSTAIPDLPAKPIIDLQAVAADPATATAALAETAATMGWMFVPRDLDQRPWRWFFVRVDTQARSRLAHLHLMPPDQDRWHDQLWFRDRLRSSPQLRAEYAEAKRRAAAAHPHDREAYGLAKQTLIVRVLDLRAD